MANRLPNLRSPLLLLCFAALAACTAGCSTPRSTATRSEAPLNPFTTDGCSLFPDGTYSNKTLWLDCCIEHDKAYWRGGTEEERKRADAELQECILRETGDAALAQLVYDGVRIGGSPFYPTWYRWGYGWRYGRTYAPLTHAERRLVAQRMREYDRTRAEQADSMHDGSDSGQQRR